MAGTASDKLFSIVAELKKADVSFLLDVIRENAITIIAAVPGQRWEIDIYLDGELDFEIFRSNGDILADEQLSELIRKFAN